MPLLPSVSPFRGDKFATAPKAQHLSREKEGNSAQNNIKFDKNNSDESNH